MAHPWLRHHESVPLEMANVAVLGTGPLLDGGWGVLPEQTFCLQIRPERSWDRMAEPVNGAASIHGPKSISDRRFGFRIRPTLDDRTKSSRSFRRNECAMRNSDRPCLYIGAVS